MDWVENVRVVCPLRALPACTAGLAPSRARRAFAPVLGASNPECSEEIDTCSWFSLKKLHVSDKGHLIPCCLCWKTKKFCCADLTACNLC
ncbi:serine-rich and transmembrane domain-containing protein 1 isoform X3 [Canis aureus]